MAFQLHLPTVAVGQSLLSQSLFVTVVSPSAVGVTLSPAPAARVGPRVPPAERCASRAAGWGHIDENFWKRRDSFEPGSTNPTHKPLVQITRNRRSGAILTKISGKEEIHLNPDPQTPLQSLPVYNRSQARIAPRLESLPHSQASV